MNRIKGAISYTLVAAACVTTATAIALFSGATAAQGVRLLAGILLLCFLPGYAWVFALFPSRALPLLERVSFAVILSVGLVPTGLIVAHALRLRVTTFSTLLVSSTLIAIGFAVGVYRRRQATAEETQAGETFFKTL